LRLAVEFLREGITQLEARGAVGTAAAHRIHLARVLRESGQLTDAFAALPAQTALSSCRRRAFLAERAELFLAAGRPEPAIADCTELVNLWRANSYLSAVETACAGALLARAYFAGEDLFGAESLALQAYDVLDPLRHPETASCLITIALVRTQITGENPMPLIDDAFSRITNAPLLAAAEKARLTAAATLRVHPQTVGAGHASACP
jgi:hypothetical protein